MGPMLRALLSSPGPLAFVLALLLFLVYAIYNMHNMHKIDVAKAKAIGTFVEVKPLGKRFYQIILNNPQGALTIDRPVSGIVGKPVLSDERVVCASSCSAIR